MPLREENYVVDVMEFYTRQKMDFRRRQEHF